MDDDNVDREDQEAAGDRNRRENQIESLKRELLNYLDKDKNENATAALKRLKPVL